MIQSDQPTCFPSELLVAVSSREDGTVLDRMAVDRHNPAVVANRQAFCAKAGGDYAANVYQIMEYGEGRSYDVITEVDQPDTEGVGTDALYTQTKGVGLFLPVADCVATVVYDPNRQAVSLAHLGRHASIAKLMSKLISYMVAKGSDPKALIIWMAPSVAQDDYCMQYFDHLNDPDWLPYAKQRDDGIYLDLRGFNAHLAEQAGVLPGNIHLSSVNTARDPNYFSYSRGDTSGRFAVTVMIRNA